MDQVRSLPLEYRADITFYAATRVNDLDARTLHEWFDPIFNTAGTATRAYPVIDAVPASDSLSAAQAQASSLGLSSLDIKTRIARIFIAKDYPHALRLAEEIRVEPKESRCTDFVIETANPYFDLLGALSDPPTRRDSRNRLRSLQVNAVRNLHNASEIEAAGRMILSLPISEPVLLELLAAYSQGISTIRSGDREIGGLDAAGQLTKVVAAVAKRAEEAGTSPLPLVNAFRSFLLASLSNSRCRFAPTDRRQEASAFNGAFRHYLSPPLSILSENDLIGRTGPSGGEEGDLPYYQQFRQPFHVLFIAHDAEMGRRSDASASRFTVGIEDVDEYIHLLDALETRGDPCKECLFISMGQLYHILLDTIPTYINPTSAIDSYVSWFDQSSMQKDDPEQWLYRFKGFLNLNRNMNQPDVDRVMKLTSQGKSLVALPHPGYSEIITASVRSQSAIVRTYGRAELLFRPTYDIKH
ncbi:hypothetical protein HDF16_006089 [Granulicella aggregans]|uniref:Uncharacterized protein n=1 Tax=Granulicella aggregans TaxID=474949 RepID=A0A7W8E6M1_9BACT|nr:hypothetical protein [Granulicella aggregans]MBB5061353.1 hypothetical protein [Granulicella aggregans]